MQPMEKIYRLIKRKEFFWPLLALPGVIFLLLPFLDGTFGDKPWKEATKNSGIIAVSVFVASLSLNPLAIVFPKMALFKAINRHRRAVGVAAFIYVLIHIFCYLMKKGSLKAVLPYLVHPVIMPGIAAFLILLPLALTSNNASVRKMGQEKWKKLHKKTYIAEFFVFLHMILQKPNVKFLALCLFLPLFILQRRRLKIERKALKKI